MKKIEASYPKSIKDCTPEQLTKWLILAPLVKGNNDRLSNMLDFHCQMISIFTGLSMNQVRKVHVDDILELSMKLLNMLAEFRPTDPAASIEIEGKRYVFEKNFEYITTGQIIDLKLIEDITMSPCEALAICYIEEGMEYCQEDTTEGALRDSEWFTWTKVLLRLAQELGKDVDTITRQPYVKTLFWMNFFKLKTEQDYILQKNG